MAVAFKFVRFMAGCRRPEAQIVHKAAAAAWAQGGAAAATAYQQDFARRTRRPVTVAKWLWERGETPWTAALATRALTFAPFIAKSFARATRIGD